MEDKLVSVGKFTDYIQAEMAKQVLEDFGIKAVVTGADASSVYSGMPFIEKPEVMVISDQSYEAEKILKEQKEQQQSQQEEMQEQ